MNQEKRIRLEIMRPALHDTTNKIKATQPDQSMRLEKKPKYPSDEKYQMKKSIKAYENLVHRIKERKFDHYEVIVKGGIDVINKKTGFIEISTSQNDQKEMIHNLNLFSRQS